MELYCFYACLIENRGDEENKQIGESDQKTIEEYSPGKSLPFLVHQVNHTGMHGQLDVSILDDQFQCADRCLEILEELHRLFPALRDHLHLPRIPNRLDPTDKEHRTQVRNSTEWSCVPQARRRTSRSPLTSRPGSTVCNHLDWDASREVSRVAFLPDTPDRLRRRCPRLPLVLWSNALWISCTFSEDYESPADARRYCRWNQPRQVFEHEETWAMDNYERHPLKRRVSREFRQCSIDLCNRRMPTVFRRSSKADP